MTKIRLTYIANDGILLSTDSVKIFIDALHTQKVPIFSSVPDNILQEMRAGNGRLNNVDYLLATHAHKDHFSQEEVGIYLGHNRVKAIFTTNKAGLLLRESTDKHLLRDVRHIVMDSAIEEMKTVEFPEVRIKYFRIEHMGPEFRDVEHFAFIVEIDGINFLHLGDSAFNKDYLTQMLQNECIDILFCNFPFVNHSLGRIVINESIRPRQIYVMHLPFAEDDQCNYRGMLKKDLEKYRETLPPMKAFYEPLEEIEFIF